MADTNAVLYRMVLPDHTCPFGVRARQLLEDDAFEVEDNILSSRDEVDRFKAERASTPPRKCLSGQTTIGGCDDLERYLDRCGRNPGAGPASPAPRQPRLRARAATRGCTWLIA